MGHHGIGADDGPVADVDARFDDGPVSYSYVVAQNSSIAPSAIQKFLVIGRGHPI